MERPRDRGTTRNRDDERLVERIRTEWAPPPMTAFERTRFDAVLQERLGHAHRRVGRWPALGVGLAAAAFAALLIVRVGVGPAPPTSGSLAAGGAAPAVPAAVPAVPAAVPAVPADWAAEVLYATPADEMTIDEAGELPAEYAAIAGVFLDL